MYQKFFVNGNLKELKNYLIMNNYDFDLIENSLYIYEEEVDYVITIMQDHNINYETVE